MEVTRVNYYLIERKTRTYPLAKCSVILDGVLRLNDIKIYDGNCGKYIAFPEKQLFNGKDDLGEQSKKDSKKSRVEFFHPVEKEFLEYLKSVIIEGYQKYVESGGFVYSPGEGSISKSLGEDEEVSE